MRTWLRRLGTILLFLAVALCFAPSLIPPFLDRIYYRGPESGHFDGERFFNPGKAPQARPHGGPARFLNRFIGSGERAEWPESVPVEPGYPPREATACPPMKGAIVENWSRCVERVDPNAMWATWIGHATVLVQAGGLNILTDPVWSDVVSPLPPLGPKRVRAPGIRFEDLPKIDLVLISHNHYDHLDLPTLKRLWERDRPAIVTGLGNDKILKDAGIRASAYDWGEGLMLRDDALVRVIRNHHWSSRWGTDRNRALWSAFAVETSAGQVFFAGDTGWGDGSWVEEAARLGPYRLAIIPIGAYEPRDAMKTNHVNPDEAVAIFERLRPRRALGIHWGTFQLTFEGMDDPPRRLAELRKARGIPARAFVATEVGRSFRVD
jgi:L-ascorbate metabolism protein UlaG (beta-lactamase superfamily)